LTIVDGGDVENVIPSKLRCRMAEEGLFGRALNGLIDESHGMLMS
jgi:hypothetical protein